jgi:integrase
MKTHMRDGSGTRHYKYVVESVDRHGNVRVYFQRRKGDPRIRLRERPGTPEFEREYQRAFSGEAAIDAATRLIDRKAAQGSLRWLCEQYYVSAAFLNGLDPETTRPRRRRILDEICQQPHRDTGQLAGTLPYRLMTPRVIAAIRDAKAETPESANMRVKALRALFAWACDPEYALAAENPAARVKYLKTSNLDGHRTWTQEDAQKFAARHPPGSMAHLAFYFFVYTGARVSDVARFGPQTVRDGKLCFTEFKGRNGKSPKYHELPILPPLRDAIEAYYAAGNERQLLYLTTRGGRQFTDGHLSGWFSDRCKEAGLNGLSAHGIRKFGATRAAEAGATDWQLKAMFGWEASKQAELYTRKANRRRMEAEAVSMLLRAGDQERATNEILPLLAVDKSGDRKTG